MGITVGSILASKLQKMKGFTDFDLSMLPKGLSVERLVKALNFLSPSIIIIHGSKVSKKKFSNKPRSDLDIVCVSAKAAFWPIEELIKNARKNFGAQEVDIDLSIVTYNGLLSIVKGESSISRSFNHGFSILQCEEAT